MPFESIHKPSAPEMVAEQIVKQLRSGELQAGTQLPPQRELAQILGVGRSSVREVINALVVMGFLKAVQGRGTFVREDVPGDDLSVVSLNAALKASSLLSLLEARELLECKSAELAAERAEAAHIHSMTAAVDQMQTPDSDYKAFLKADTEFHTGLAEATGNMVICELTKLLMDKTVHHHDRLKARRFSPNYRQASISSAAQVVRHVENGNGQAAADAMRQHLKVIETELKEVLV